MDRPVQNSAVEWMREEWCDTCVIINYVKDLLRGDFSFLVVFISGLTTLSSGLMLGSGAHMIPAVLVALSAYFVVTLLVVRTSQTFVRQRTGTCLDVAVIAKMLADAPIEKFVSNQCLTECPVSHLKRMIEVRQRPHEDSNSLSVGKSLHEYRFNELLNAVRRCRKYSDSCCICFEDYHPGDELRILSQCQHEFHRRCLDRWIYTFAKPRSGPSKMVKPKCPLCNAALSTMVDKKD